MKNKLKVVFLTVLTAISVLAVCLFAGCADYEAIYNDDAKIISSNSHTTIAEVKTETLSGYSYSCSKFSGVKTIKNYTVESGSSIDLSLAVESGDFKLVLTNSDTVYVLAEGSYEGVLLIENVPSGKYKLKMVGLEAEFQLHINY